MRIVYRMRGLLGDATEDMVNSLESGRGQSESVARKPQTLPYFLHAHISVTYFSSTVMCFKPTLLKENPSDLLIGSKTETSSVYFFDSKLFLRRGYDSNSIQIISDKCQAHTAQIHAFLISPRMILIFQKKNS